jgi:PAS domain S-box-containing protein
MAGAILFALPALHPMLRPTVGVPSHLLWFAHVLPIALISYVFGFRGALVAVTLSTLGVAAGERLFGAGYGHGADDTTIVALSVAVGLSGALIAAFALAVRAEQAQRRDLRRQFGAALDASPEAVVLLDADRRIQYANAAARRAFGVQLGELAGTGFERLIATGPADERSPLFDATDGRPVAVVARTAAGRPFAAELSVSAARDASGLATSYLVALRDQSEKLVAEQAQRRTQTLSELGAVVAGIAHELNNPLTGLLSYAEVVREEPDLPASVREDVDVLYHEAQRAAGIARQLLRLVRLGEGTREIVEVNSLVQQALRPRAASFAAHGIHVRCSLADVLLRISAAAGEIEQVLANLLGNAEHAMHRAHAGGQLTASTRLSDGFVEITVSDDGPGIPLEHMPRLFDAFFTTKPVGSGTGLGLSIARRIARDHGGDLVATSTPGQGAAFTLRLPEARTTFVTTKGADAAVVPSTGGAMRLLIIDDEPSIRHAFERLLTRRGYRVATAATLGDAEAALALGTFDLVFCDLHLGGASGLDFYRAVVSRMPALAKRFIFMSGDVMSQELRDVVAQTGARYLLKPLDSSALVQEIEQNRAGAPPALTAPA